MSNVDADDYPSGLVFGQTTKVSFFFRKIFSSTAYDQAARLVVGSEKRDLLASNSVVSLESIL